MKQLIFDIETIGTESTAVCLEASFLVYDLKRDAHKSLDSLNPVTFKLSVKDQIDAGRTVCPETKIWWKEQIKLEPSLAKIVMPSPNDLTMMEFFNALRNYLREEGYAKNDWAWQRGTLDIMVIDSIFKQLDVDRNAFPIKWWDIRDLRTAIDLYGEGASRGYTPDYKTKILKELPNFVKHDARYDILLEVFMLREVGLFETEPF